MGKVFINERITEAFANKIVKEIEAENESLDVHIDSPGGSVYKGFLIFNALQRKKDILSTYVDGLAYSAASWIALAAPKERRFMSRAAQFGVHQALNPIGGNKEELKSSIENLEAIDKIQIEIYSKSTGISEDRIKAIMKKGKPLSIDEAKEFGFQEYNQEKIAAYFNTEHMDLFEKMAAIFKDDKTILKEEAEKEVKENLEKAESIEEQMLSQFASKADFEALKKYMEPFIEAITDKWADLPTKADLQNISAAQAKIAVAEAMSKIKSNGIAPTAEEIISEVKEGQKQETFEPLTLGNMNWKDLTKKDN
jgi:ATP-dependent protease ClpP protease subunit